MDYLAIRKRTVDLCGSMDVEDYVAQLVAFTSPPKWHLAHTTWFFEEMILKCFLDEYQEFDKDFSFLFNSYYNNVGERTLRGERGLSRPSVKNVYAYRAYVDKHILQLLENAVSDEVSELIVLGLNHEQQHQELLITDLKFTLGKNPIHPTYLDQGELVNGYNSASNWVKINEGVYKVGYDGEGFSFDNERNRHKVYLQEFELANFLVTNGDYMNFIESGGYQNFNYWLDEGWSWVSENKINAPLYWKKEKDTWCHFTLGGLIPVDPKAILCHVNFYEAAAFAFWKEMRLPTEFEWEAAADQIECGQRWEWTNSAYLPYPGFKIAAGAVGEYNGKFMVNQMVLKGGSVATAKGHSRKSYRNFFHPHYQWQYSGIRLAR